LNQRRAIVAELLLASLVAHAAGCAAARTTRTAGYTPTAFGTAPAPQATPTPRPQAEGTAGTIPSTSGPVVRGQDGDAGPYHRFVQQDPGSDQYTRSRMPVTVAQSNPAAGFDFTGPAASAAAPAAGVPSARASVRQPGGSAPLFAPPPTAGAATVPSGMPPPPTSSLPPAVAPALPPPPPYIDIDPTMSTPVDIYVDETQTGRFMFGVGVNSDAGVTGQIVLDERHFDITRVPSSWSDFVEGTAFRGGGQGLRLEAMPGTRVQRYLASFTEPYLLHSMISMTASGFLFERNYIDWSERRAGGRLAFGYRLTHDLSVSAALRGEHVTIYNPRVVRFVPELGRVVGDNDLFSGRVTLTHDTRDHPFAPTEGHLIEMSFEQAFGEFSYPRGELDFRKYFLVRERPDGSGRHTLGYSFQVGVTGADTPLFENYFAGGFSTLRGFDFRGASPVDDTLHTVRVGGQFKFIGSAEYVFPVTADDMFKGALFVDFGTIERSVGIHGENFRVAPGFGIRLNIPAMGPAPLAFDFAFPLHKATTDDTRVFSFFVGVGR
jgi:outer membrane protein insertion porin family